MIGEHPCLYSECPYYRGAVKRDDDGNAIKIFCAFPLRVSKKMMKIDPSECIRTRKGGYTQILKHIEQNYQDGF